MKKGIAIAGNLIVDHVKEIDSYPEKGMLCNINNVSKSVRRVCAEYNNRSGKDR